MPVLNADIAAGRGFQAREEYYDVLDQNIAAEQVCTCMCMCVYMSMPIRVAHLIVLGFATQLQAAWRGKRVRKAIEEGDFEFLGAYSTLAALHHMAAPIECWRCLPCVGAC